MDMFHSHVELPKGINYKQWKNHLSRYLPAVPCWQHPRRLLSSNIHPFQSVVDRVGFSRVGCCRIINPCCWRTVLRQPDPCARESSTLSAFQAMWIHLKLCFMFVHTIPLLNHTPTWDIKPLYIQHKTCRLDWMCFFAVVDPISQQTNTHSRASDKPHHQGVELVPWYNPASAWTWNQAAEPVQRG